MGTINSRRMDSDNDNLNFPDSGFTVILQYLIRRLDNCLLPKKTKTKSFNFSGHFLNILFFYQKFA